jgi:hypothetical protein
LIQKSFEHFGILKNYFYKVLEKVLNSEIMYQWMKMFALTNAVHLVKSLENVLRHVRKSGMSGI